MNWHPLLSLLLLPLTLTAAPQDDAYVLGPDSQQRREGVPQGKVLQMPAWTESQIFPGTTRDWWIYVPAQYQAGTPANVMIFCDGAGFVKEDGTFRVPVVFDNLIAAGEMPVTIGIFIQPGQFPPAQGESKPRSNRSFEYDSLGDRYARFLIEEILPAVAKDYTLTEDPEKRALVGNSSGGICAFTAAWERPDTFRRVISHIGSFTNIRGGYVYPALIRKTPKKPLRVFLQDGRNDLDNQFGNWPLANQDMAAALQFAGYPHQLVLGEGTHNAKHGASLFPDTVRWIWKD
ncbi:MAG: esterase family protein [Verrucomicrobiales bacterium]|nr:esterase family protein [Verrucomicrobiales bacterium]